MSKRKKYEAIRLNTRPVWEMGKGHSSHMSGSGQHDNRPKRLRTRGDQRREAIKDYD